MKRSSGRRSSAVSASTKSALRIGEVQFRAIVHDRTGDEVPHFHVDVGSGEVAIELLPAGAVCLSAAHGDPIQGTVTPPELKLVLDTARDAYGDLVRLWNGVR